MKRKNMLKLIVGINLVAAMVISIPLMTGCAAPTPPPEVEPVVIGYVGSFASDGALSAMRGAEIAIDEFNEAGGICGGRPIKYVKADSAEYTPEGLKALEYLNEVEHIDFLVNATIDDVTLGMLPRMTEYRVPTVTCWASTYMPLLEMAEDYDTYKWFFEKHINDAFIATGMIMYAGWLHEELGWDSCVILQEDTSWGEAVGPFLESELPLSAGIEVIDRIAYDIDSVDFSPIFAKIVAEDPDFTYILGAVRDVVPAAQYMEQQVPIPITGVLVSGFGPDFWEDTGGMAAGITLFNTIPNYSLDLDPVSQAFLDKYEARYTTRPASPHFTGFYAYYGVQDAIQAAQRVYEAGLGSGFEPLDAWVEEMENTNTVLYKDDEVFFVGRYYKPGEADLIMGGEWPHSMKFDINVVDGNHPGCATQWYEDGTTGCIWPERYKTGEIAFPAWIPREKLPEKYR